MDLRVHVTPDGSLEFRTPAQEPVARLSANAVTALTTLAQVPPELNAVVHQHVQTIVRHLPAERAMLTQAGLISSRDDGSVQLTRAGRRFAAWLTQEWKPWKRYLRRIPAEAVAVWRWTVTYRAG